MKRFLYSALFAFLALTPFLLARAASEVTVEESFPTDVPSDLDRVRVQHQAIKALLLAEMKLLNLDVAVYEEALQKRFKTWQTELNQKYTAAQLPLNPVGLSDFIPWEGFFRHFTVIKFTAKEEKGDVWQMTVQGEAEPKLLELHYQNIVKEGAPGKRLYLSVDVTPMNFSWEDLQLKGAREFVQPLENEWVKWFADGRLPMNVGEIVLCGERCKSALIKWREQDEKKMQLFVSPELMGHLLLAVEMNLERQLMSGPLPDTNMSMGGGVVLTDLDSKRRIHWLDLSPEKHILRASTPKDFNSALATLCYRAPLGKFLEFKTVAGQSALASRSLVIKLENPAHMGQALRLLEWLKTKGKSMSAEGKLDSFKRSEARILIYFVGEGNKFKSLVSGVKELESEWGKSVTVRDLGEELVYGLPGAATSP